MDGWISQYIIRYAIINYIAGTSQIYITKLCGILRDTRYICRAGKRSSLQDFLDYIIYYNIMKTHVQGNTHIPVYYIL